MTPSPWTIYSARTRAGLSQSQAAALVGLKGGRQTWAGYEHGRIQISQAVWELFLIKTGQMTVEPWRKK